MARRILRPIVVWSPDRSADGDILKSRCGRFHVITGTGAHYTLLDRGQAVARSNREDSLKRLAEELARGRKIAHAA